MYTKFIDKANKMMSAFRSARLLSVLANTFLSVRSISMLVVPMLNNHLNWLYKNIWHLVLKGDTSFKYVHPTVKSLETNTEKYDKKYSARLGPPL